MAKIIYSSYIDDKYLINLKKDLTELECDLSEGQLYDYAVDYKEIEFKDFIADCEYYNKLSKDIEGYVIIGKRVTHPHYAYYIGKGGKFKNVYTDSLKEAVLKCCEDRDEVNIVDNNGSLRIETCDHDGCNYFRIYKISNNRIHNINFNKWRKESA